MENPLLNTPNGDDFGTPKKAHPTEPNVRDLWWPMAKMAQTNHIWVPNPSLIFFRSMEPPQKRSLPGNPPQKNMDPIWCSFLRPVIFRFHVSCLKRCILLLFHNSWQLWIQRFEWKKIIPPKNGSKFITCRQGAIGKFNLNLISTNRPTLKLTVRTWNTGVGSEFPFGEKRPPARCYYVSFGDVNQSIKSQGA